FKFKVKDFVQELVKIQVAQKKVKIAFENAYSSSKVELIPSKIKNANKRLKTRRAVKDMLRKRFEKQRELIER
nr:hypothetical protein [Tanacetum cinerariifolium]